MIPVTLVKLDNYPGFVGTYDTVNWWETEPLENVDRIIDAAWVYGQYHVCIAKNTSDTYSIFQSRDNGRSWQRVLTTDEVLKSVLRIDYGSVLVSSSGGWWKSDNSGTTWSKVSSSAPNCHTVRELTNEILVALDGKYIWRSNNAGRTWERASTIDALMVIDENDTVWDYIRSSNFPISTNYPTVDGSYYMVLAGYTLPQEAHHFYDRPYTIKFVLSIDGGKNFYTVYRNRYNQSRNIFEWDMSDVISKICEGNPDATITQIEMTHVSRGYGEHFRGLGAFMPHFVIQILLPTNILRHYYVYPVEEHDWVRYKASAKFDALYTPMATLKSEEVQLVGRSGTGNWIIFSGRSTNNTPMIVYSNDFGETWKYVDLSATTMYTDPSLTQQSATSPLQEDYFVYLGYVVPWCLNLWYNYGSYSRRSLSYDMDFTAKHLLVTRNKQYLMDLLLEQQRTKGITQDVLIEKTWTNDILMDAALLLAHVDKSIPGDVLFLKTVDQLYLSDTLILKTCDIDKIFRMTSVLRLPKPYDTDMLLKSSSPRCYLKTDVLVAKTQESQYEMGLTIQDTIVYDILTNLERYSPQFPAIGLGYKRRGYPIFDSRKETKE